METREENMSPCLMRITAESEALVSDRHYLALGPVLSSLSVCLTHCSSGVFFSHSCGRDDGSHSGTEGVMGTSLGSDTGLQ